MIKVCVRESEPVWARVDLYLSACLCFRVSAALTIFVLKHSATKTNFGSNYNMVVAPNRAPHIALQRICHVMKKGVHSYAILA